MKNTAKTERPTNYRENRRRQERTLLFLVMGVLVVVGTGLVALIWGVTTAIFSSICLVSGAILIGGLWLLLSFLQKFVGE